MLRFDGKSYSDQYVKTAIHAAEEAAMPEADPVESSNTPLYLACETPRGVLLAYAVYEEDEYPGIAVDLDEKETRDQVGLVTTEVNTTAGDMLTTYVFSNLNVDEYTHEIRHTKGDAE